jgi:4'-phosphopantetheinyl transferase
MPNNFPILSDGELHVWQAKVDPAGEEMSKLVRLLSPDERARAARFHFDRDRRRFVAGRGILRTILARYVGREPEALAFRYSPSGKPSLPGTTLQFNLAHSDGLAAIAVARGGAVGIDLEHVRPVPDCDRIMNSHFSAAEVEAISALPPAAQLRAFFTCWTRKEAYLKATGDGITAALDRFRVSVVPGSAPRLLHVEGAPQEATRWAFHDLPLGPDYIGVVAFEKAIRAVKYFFWCAVS